MIKSIISLLLIGAVAASAYKIAPRGIVEDVVRCGGAAEFRQLRVTGCTTSPCEVAVGAEVVIEIDFSPERDCAALGFKLFVVVNGEIHSVLDAPIPGSSVVGGSPYTVTYPLTLQDAELQGQTFTVIAQVYCQATELTEVCIGAEVSLT